MSILLTGLTYKAVSKILIEFILLYPRKIDKSLQETSFPYVISLFSTDMNSRAHILME